MVSGLLSQVSAGEFQGHCQYCRAVRGLFVDKGIVKEPQELSRDWGGSIRNPSSSQMEATQEGSEAGSWLLTFSSSSMPSVPQKETGEVLLRLGQSVFTTINSL